MEGKDELSDLARNAKNSNTLCKFRLIHEFKMTLRSKVPSIILVFAVASASQASDGQGDAAFVPDEYNNNASDQLATTNQTADSFVEYVQSSLSDVAERISERAKKAGVRPSVRLPSSSLVPIPAHDGLITSMAGALGGGQNTGAGSTARQRGGAGEVQTGKPGNSGDSVLTPALN